MIGDAEGAHLPNTDTLRLLGLAPFSFYLGGSHYFKCARPDSDYDFLTPDRPGVVEFLEAAGFHRVGGMEYAQPAIDDNTRGVFQKGSVQVQVHYDVTSARIARDILSTHFADDHKAVRGETRSRMWEACIRLAKTIPTIRAEVDLQS